MVIAGAAAASYLEFHDPRLAIAGAAAAGAAMLVAARWRARRHEMKALTGLRNMTPAGFERAVAAWFAREGWVVEHRGRSGDHGIDVLAFHGGEVVAIQCKRYAETAAVSPAQVRELYGAAVAAGATRALLVTTGRVSQAARAWVSTLPPVAPAMDLLAAQEVADVATGRVRIVPSGDHG